MSSEDPIFIKLITSVDFYTAIISLITAGVLKRTLYNQDKNHKEDKKIELFIKSLDDFQKYIDGLKEYYVEPKDKEKGGDWLTGEYALQAIIDNSINEHDDYIRIRYIRGPILNPLIKKIYTSINLLEDLPEYISEKYKSMLKNSINYNVQRFLFLEKRYLESIVNKKNNQELVEFEQKRVDFIKKVNSYNLLDDLSKNDTDYLKRVPLVHDTPTIKLYIYNDGQWEELVKE